MSNPRYVPRDYAAHPRDFGRRPNIEWLQDDPDWTKQEFAQRDASHLQHQVAYGVLEHYMPRSPTKKMTTLALALAIPYERLQKVLTGRAVMQLEDLGRLRGLIGEEMDIWLVRGKYAVLIKQATQIVEARKEQQRIRGHAPLR